MAKTTTCAMVCILTVLICCCIYNNRTKWAKVDGQTFKTGAAIIHKLGSLDRDPELAVISNIYIINQSLLIFKAQHYTVTHYDHHLRCFLITPCHTTSFIPYIKLPLHRPIHPRKCRVLPEDIIVIMPHYLI